MRERRLQTYLLLVLLVAATVPSIIVGGFELLGVHAAYQKALNQQHARAQALSEEVGNYVAVHARAVRTLARQLETVPDPTNHIKRQRLDHHGAVCIVPVLLWTVRTYLMGQALMREL